MWWRHLRDGGMTRGSRGEEGTYRNKFPVPASRTLSEKEERKGNRETGKWRLGGQQKHWHHKGEVFLCVMGQNTSKARGWKRIIILSVSSPTGVSSEGVGKCDWEEVKLLDLWGKGFGCYMNMNGEDLMSFWANITTVISTVLWENKCLKYRWGKIVSCVKTLWVSFYKAYNIFYDLWCWCEDKSC